MRERLSYGVFRAWIPTAPRVAHCRLFVNDAYRGLYLLEERIRTDLLKSRYPGEEVGYLYHLRTGDPEPFTWRGADPASYFPRPWERVTFELDGDHTIIPRFLDILNHRPAEVGSVCDLDNLTRFLALEAAVISRDGILRDAGSPQNHYIYWRFPTGKFELIPWDLDLSWDKREVARSIFHNFDNTRIAAVVRDTPELQARYKVHLAEAIRTLTRPELMDPQIDFIFALIRDAAHADPYKAISNTYFDTMPDYLKETARLRYDNLRAQLGVP